MHRFKENVKYDIGLIQVVATHGTATCTGHPVDMQKYNNFCGLIAGGIGLGTNNVGSFVAYIAESTDSLTFSTNYLATSATIATATGTAKGYGDSVECRAEQMSDGYRYLRVEVRPSVTGTSNLVVIGNLRFNSRYPQATLPTP